MSAPNALQVAAAGAYEHVLNDLTPVFGREAGMAVRLAVANAAGVIKHLEAGQPADVVLTSAAGIAQLVAAGLADANTAAEIGRVGLGVAVRRQKPAFCRKPGRTLSAPSCRGKQPSA